MADGTKVKVHVEKMLPVKVRGGERALLKIETEGETEPAWAVASYIPNAPDHGGPETLVFRSDSEGNVEDWEDIAGMAGMTIVEAIKDLHNFLNGKPRKRPEKGLGDLMDALSVMANPPSGDYYLEDDDD